MGLDVYTGSIKSSIGKPEDFQDIAEYNANLDITLKVISKIKENIADQTGSPPDWNENDSLEKDEDFSDYETIGNYNVIHHLRRYAAHIDLNKTPPESPADFAEAGNDEFLLKIYDNKEETTFPHLVDHSDCDGYYIPVAFSQPIWIDTLDFGLNNEPISVGSTNKLLEELEKINVYLNVGLDDLDNLENFSELVAEDPWEFEKWTWAVLYKMCLRSIETNQPIIFC